MKRFQTETGKVLQGALGSVEVAIVSILPNGKLYVAGSGSTPLTKMLLRQGLHEIDRLAE